MKINTQISVGELLDKFSILKIKSNKIKDPEKILNINKEKKYLNQIIESELSQYNYLEERIKELVNVNSKLWDIEDLIREKERAKEFDEEFQELARSVYFTNDKRFSIKDKINRESGSEFQEQKSYSEY
jgi:predicted nuclease with TOPRIM domain